MRDCPYKGTSIDKFSHNFISQHPAWLYKRSKHLPLDACPLPHPLPPSSRRVMLSVEAATAGLLHEILVRLQRGLLLSLFLADLGKNNLAKDGAAPDGFLEGGLLGLAGAGAATAAAAAARHADSGKGLGEAAAFDVLRGILQVVVVVIVVDFVAEAGDALLQLDGEDGLLELGAGLLGAAQLGKQVVLGGVLATQPNMSQGFLEGGGQWMKGDGW